MLRKYAAFIGLCLGFFLVIMDTTTVPLTYTTLMNVFGVSPAMVAWVNNIYLITYAAFLLLGGRLGDSANRKLVVLGAYFALGAGALLSGAGHSFAEVILGRALMGVGAGLLTPQSMAYISILFADGGRGTALGIWGAVAGAAALTGPIVTQAFLAAGDWRWVMWINVPIALACLLIAVWSLPSLQGRGIKLRDTAVSALCGLCVAGAVAGIQFIAVARSLLSMGGVLFFVGAVAAALLIRHDLRQGSGYILSADLWRDRAFLRICLVSGLLGFGVTGFYLPIAFLLDARMHFGSVATSVVMSTIALSNAFVGPFAGHLSDRTKPEFIVKRGLLLFAAANALHGVIGIFMAGGTAALVTLCAVMVVAGAGTGLAFAPLANIALSRAQRATVGQAAAFFNSVRQVMSALGGVIVAIVFDSLVRMQLDRDVDVTVANLRESSTVTATATFACFMIIALGLAAAAVYISRTNAQQVPEVVRS
ncbi:MFS transporter [Sorangium sp. So ce118]